MNNCQKLFSVCALTMLTQAAFAQSAPELGFAKEFAVLSAPGGAVTCTDSLISGDVGSSGVPASIVQTSCSITGAVVAPVDARVTTDFNDAYAKLGAVGCTKTFTAAESTLTDTALSLTPGVYCFPAAATFTRTTITLQGDSDDLWIFKVGSPEVVGALTGTGLSVVMAGGQACNVYWWVNAATTLTTSGFQGTILSGAAITATGLANPNTAYNGNMLAKAGVTLTNFSVTGCEGGISNPAPSKKKCNQGVGNGPEACDPGNSNQGNDARSNDEEGGTPGYPGRKGGNKK